MYNEECAVILLLAQGLLAQEATSELRTRTVTITTTRTTTVRSPTSSINSAPTMLTEQDDYTFQGCFKQPSTDDTGGIPGYDYIIPANASDFEKLTPSLCAKLCGIAKTTTGESYKYAAVSSGRDCYCSTAISPDTEKDLDESCPLSCPGDATQSCGGNGHFAIYSLETARTSNTAQISDQQSTATSSGAPSALFAAENAQDDQPGKAPIGPTIGVIVGSVLGLILFCALIFIGVKIHRRNQHLKSSGHRRIESQAGILKFGLGGEKEKRQSVAFKHRHRIITDGPFSTMKTPTRENTGTWLFGGSKKAGENLAIGNGSTSGVEWRLDNNALRGSGLSPRTPSAARDNDGMTLPAHQIPETVAQVPTLGERAWHRRRNSVPFPPKAAAGAVGKDKLEPGQGSSSNQHGAESFMKKGDIPTLPVLDFDTPAKGGSVEGRKGGPEPSPPFTLWTIPSTPSLHRLNGMEDGKRGEKEKADE